jgi:transcription antitermination factor NusA-like protein
MNEASKDISIDDVKDIAEKLQIPFNDFDVEQLYKGVLVEMEHGTQNSKTNVTNDDLEMTIKIAWAHLNEFPDYYDRLEKMEKVAEDYWASRPRRNFTDLL